MKSQSTNAVKYQSSNPFLRFALIQFYKSITELFPSVQNVLDAGSGEGYGARELFEVQPTLEMVGIDYSFDALQQVSSVIPSLSVAVADASKLPFTNQSFDLVMSLEVLEHILQPDRAVAEYMRVSRNYLLLSVPNEPLFRMLRMIRGDNIMQFGNHPEHVNHWNIYSFGSFLTSCGLTVIKRSSPPPYIWSIILCQV